MAKWKDKEKKYDNPEVVSSELKFGDFRLSIHRHIDYKKDKWLASSQFFSCRQMDSTDIEQKKKKIVEKGEAMSNSDLFDLWTLNKLSEAEHKNKDGAA